MIKWEAIRNEQLGLWNIKDSEGDIIAETCYGSVAYAISTIPELFEVCEWALGWIKEYEHYISDGPSNDLKKFNNAIKLLEAFKGVKELTS